MKKIDFWYSDKNNNCHIHTIEARNRKDFWKKCNNFLSSNNYVFERLTNTWLRSKMFAD